MTRTIEIPWRRYALIAELAKRLDGIREQFSKTALVKLVFFLQEVYGVDCGYDFAMYSYGPFDSQLLNDLALVKHFGCVTVEAVSSALGGYHIRPTNEADCVRDRAAKFLDARETQKALDSLVKTYGAKSARDLELRATIVYIERDLRRKGKEATKFDVCRIVNEIKPKFPSQEIERAVNELSECKHLSLAA